MRFHGAAATPVLWFEWYINLTDKTTVVELSMLNMVTKVLPHVDHCSTCPSVCSYHVLLTAV